MEDHRADPPAQIAGYQPIQRTGSPVGDRDPGTIPARTFAALCDILDCTPNDLFEPFVEMRAAKTADAPRRPENFGVTTEPRIARRIRVIAPDDDG